MNIWDEIYEKKVWGEGSGPGSTEETTREYREFLEDFISGLGVNHVTDFGCGDGTVSSLVNWLRAGVLVLNSYDPCRSILNVASGKIPGGNYIISERCAFDSAVGIAIIKDVFQHLSWASIGRVMCGLSRCPFLLITNDIPRPEDGHDIKDGEWRPIDIRSLGYTCAVVKEFDSVPLRKRVLLVTNR